MSRAPKQQGAPMMEALYKAATAIVQSVRGVATSEGVPCDTLCMPILMGDMRVTIEHGAEVASRNTVEAAQMRAGIQPLSAPAADIALREACKLLSDYAGSLEYRLGVEVNATPADKARLEARRNRCRDIIKTLKRIRWEGRKP